MLQDAGGRENPDIYPDRFQMIVESYIGGLLKHAKSGKGINIEFEKRDDKNNRDRE